jgi:hypothetical protein
VACRWPAAARLQADGPQGLLRGRESHAVDGHGCAGDRLRAARGAVSVSPWDSRTDGNHGVQGQGLPHVALPNERLGLSDQAPTNSGLDLALPVGLEGGAGRLMPFSDDIELGPPSGRLEAIRRCFREACLSVKRRWLLWRHKPYEGSCWEDWARKR